MSSANKIVLFHYSFSPYARRIVWYLSLRGIEYSQCIQPPTLPREDLTALGVKYRRIPILAIGRDIYCDSRLILSKLEEKFSEGALGSKTTDGKGIEKLLEKWTIDGGVFLTASQLIPTSLPLMNDSKFTADRQDYTGRSWKPIDVEKRRPEALAEMRDAFEFLESTLLADGRRWLLKTEKPSLADIQAIWPFDWLVGLKGALPPAQFSEQTFPRVFAWLKRFKDALAFAKSLSARPVTLTGSDAVKQIVDANFAEPEGEVEETDPLRLRKGDIVEVWPTDSGFRHHDLGKLVGLTRTEVVLESKTKMGKVVRIHAPRHGFRIVKSTGDTKASL